MLKRTHYCGRISSSEIGRNVTVSGWVHRRRDLGNLVFVLIRDVTGLVQVVFDQSTDPETAKKVADLSQEWVISVSGQVIKRTAENINKSMTTGEIEIRAVELFVHSSSETPPFVIDERETAGENMRLKYRYLDLRRPNLTKNLVLRSRLTHNIREFFVSNDFHEVETPILIKSTPEGARDYVVPCRVQAGKFYALPQSPQLLKQLLMVSGMDRYFQFCRCFRDEDLRADRQPEFTQIDLEMSFVDEDDVLFTCEKMLQYALKKTFDMDIPLPIPRYTYAEVISRFGSDKPDLRYGLEIIDLTEEVKGSDFKVFSSVAAGGKVACIALQPEEAFSRKQITEYEETLKKEFRIGGLAFTRFENGVMDGGLSKFLSPEIQKKIIDKTGIPAGFIFFVADFDAEKACCSLGLLRRMIAARENLIPENQYNFLWVTKFPLFEKDELNNRIAPKHHIFTHPRDEDMEFLETEPLKVHGKLYDLVLNGVELGSGSIRINKPDLQKRVLKLINMTDAQADDRFGFLMDSFRYGAPPHGGFAFGFDRLMMLLAGETSIRDVIAFPKTTSGSCQLSGAPDSLDETQLCELSISINEPAGT